MDNDKNEPGKYEEIRRLTEDEGLSASQVAARVGKTRNAVIGIWHRYGIRPRRMQSKKKCQPQKE